MESQAPSGDAYLVRGHRSGVILAVIDGLGHGPEAAAAAQAAVKILRSDLSDDLVSLMRRCHDALRATRGAAISLVACDEPGRRLTWLGVGNVAGVLLRSADRAEGHGEKLLLRSGVVGYRLPTLRSQVVSVESGDTLVMATDGIRSGFWQDADPARSPGRVAREILSRHGRREDDALVLVAGFGSRRP